MGAASNNLFFVWNQRSPRLCDRIGSRRGFLTKQGFVEFIRIEAGCQESFTPKDNLAHIEFNNFRNNI